MTSQHYGYWLRLASAAAVLAALSMIIVKGYAWIETDSASVLASLTDSVFDISVSIVNFFIVRYALIPADDDHRFGHGKAESLAGLIQAAFLTGSAILLIFHSVGRLSHPMPIKNIDLGLSSIYFSIVITLALVFIQYLALKKTDSIAIKADSMHYKGDLFMNLGVIAALYLSQAGYTSMDGWIAIFIALYLFYGAYEIGIESIQSLMDRELSYEEQQKILTVTTNVDNVQGLHDLRTRRSGGTVFIQLHLELEDDLTLLQAHNISEAVEHALMAEFPLSDVLIHLDPISVVAGAKEKVSYNDGNSIIS